ncbi:MAG TPA: disulfide isomerase DsbC N-terminal domain-containing protein, partial [Steroidobacteraceae bacterium]|nr:disulfide isomerase DsbC N-terminal domain-containing protein [Steroidobacteraceae bacterium]
MTFKIAASLLVFCMGAGPAFAQTKAATPAAATTGPSAKADPRAAIVKKIDGIKLEDVRMTPVSGVYEVTHGADISYLSGDGRYAILGDMIDLDSDSNLSETRRRGIRARMIETVPENEM